MGVFRHTQPSVGGGCGREPRWCPTHPLTLHVSLWGVFPRGAGPPCCPHAAKRQAPCTPNPGPAREPAVRCRRDPGPLSLPFQLLWRERATQTPLRKGNRQAGVTFRFPSASGVPRGDACPRAPGAVCGVSEAVPLPALAVLGGWTWDGKPVTPAERTVPGHIRSSHPCRGLEKGYGPWVPLTVHTQVGLGRGDQVHDQTLDVRGRLDGRAWGVEMPPISEAFFSWQLNSHKFSREDGLKRTKF